ncbi:hypothetical protein D3C79_485460 [compost metagenome]
MIINSPFPNDKTIGIIAICCIKNSVYFFFIVSGHAYARQKALEIKCIMVGNSIFLTFESHIFYPIFLHKSWIEREYCLCEITFGLNRCNLIERCHLSFSGHWAKACQNTDEKGEKTVLQVYHTLKIILDRNRITVWFHKKQQYHYQAWIF